MDVKQSTTVSATLPETNIDNIAPENQWLEDEFPFGFGEGKHLQIVGIIQEQNDNLQDGMFPLSECWLVTSRV